jgi:hypothetical protein
MASGHQPYSGYEAVASGSTVTSQGAFKAHPGSANHPRVFPDNLDGQGRDYDAEQARPIAPATPVASEARPTNSRGTSWDLLSGIKRSYEDFDTQGATETHFVYADGDIPKNEVSLRCVRFS